MIIMKTGIRTFSGTTLRTRETMIFDPIITNEAAIPIPKPSRAEREVARVGQRPIIKMRIGFSRIIPFQR
jgi:hypothetical protein